VYINQSYKKIPGAMSCLQQTGTLIDEAQRDEKVLKQG
jgi:hypothetical protein